MNDKLKKLIVEYLLKDLYSVEIIYYRDSIWFIDRENRYWYFEYHKVDKHLWWRWSHFTQGLKIFSMDGEKEQTIFGELVNMILTKKQILEAKYPNKIFKTVGSVMNFEDKVDKVLNSEVETTRARFFNGEWRVEEILNSEVETTQSAFFGDTNDVIDSVLNYEVEKTGGVFYNDEIITQEVLDSDVNISSGEMIDENEMMNKVLEIQNIQPTERGTSDMVDFVLDVEDYTPWDGKIKHQVSEVITQSPKLIEKQYDIDVVLDNTIEIEKIGYSKTHRLRPVTGALDYNDNPVEIKSIEKLKGENPFQDIIVSHILDESDKVTVKLKMKEDDYVKTYSHDVYMCDHLVQNVLDIGVNSIHYDTHNHQPIVDGILKKA